MASFNRAEPDRRHSHRHTVTRRNERTISPRRRDWADRPLSERQDQRLHRMELVPWSREDARDDSLGHWRRQDSTVAPLYRQPSHVLPRQRGGLPWATPIIRPA